MACAIVEVVIANFTNHGMIILFSFLLKAWGATMHLVHLFNGLDEGNDGLRQSDVIDKVFEIYKAEADADTCDADSDLDELGEDIKSRIIAKVGAYYNIEIDRNEVHTCGELVHYVMTHQGETTADILKNSWDSSGMLQSYENLLTLKELAAMGHSTEGFLGKLADNFLAMVNTFKTNVFKFTKALKRSEMRIFVEGNYFLCRDVDKEPFTKFMDMDVDIPTGMITTYSNAVDYVTGVYDQLDALNYGSTILGTLKELRYKLYNNNPSGLTSFSVARGVAEKERVLKWALSVQQKCYKDHGAAPKMKFKKAYASMEEFVGIKDKLLSLETKLQDVDKFVDNMDDISLVIGDMTNYIESNTVPQTFIKGLADGTRIVGASFDLYGQTAMRQMALEHNHILNYINLYKTK